MVEEFNEFLEDLYTEIYNICSVDNKSVTVWSERWMLENNTITKYFLLENNINEIKYSDITKLSISILKEDINDFNYQVRIKSNYSIGTNILFIKIEDEKNIKDYILEIIKIQYSSIVAIFDLCGFNKNDITKRYIKNRRLEKLNDLENEKEI